MIDFFQYLFLAAVIYWIVAIYNKPSSWTYYLQFMPVFGFIRYMRLQDTPAEAWHTAFTFGGLLAAGAIVICVQQRIVMNRIYLGANAYLMLGASAFLFDMPTVLKWYSSSQGGPFFTMIAIIGLLTTLFTKTGFVGKKGLNKDAVRYGSFLLLAATFMALIWSIQNASQGIMVAVVVPFIVLKFIQKQMKYHIS